MIYAFFNPFAHLNRSYIFSRCERTLYNVHACARSQSPHSFSIRTLRFHSPDHLLFVLILRMIFRCERKTSPIVAFAFLNISCAHNQLTVLLCAVMAETQTKNSKIEERRPIRYTLTCTLNDPIRRSPFQISNADRVWPWRVPRTKRITTAPNVFAAQICNSPV